MAVDERDTCNSNANIRCKRCHCWRAEGKFYIAGVPVQRVNMTAGAQQPDPLRISWRPEFRIKGKHVKGKKGLR